MKRADEQGFTLVEAVVALLVISLALAAVLQLARLSASDQRRTVTQVVSAKDDRRVVRQIEAEIQKVEPLYADQFTATPQGLRCSSSATASCELSAPKGYQFRYVVDGAEVTRWPSSGVLEETNVYAPERRLSALILLDKQGRVAAAIELRVDHPVDCRFDMISRACRRPETGGVETPASPGEGP